ncbi:hypothetical protein EYF80_022243 [Liparis tanakae]|uniref:Uncharacterized protein n=1 Tax=Liparis tanakae TaxID=230148 RepID=A0A4Z2HPP6_9TELE|nr:hypothetical protein EYF80_022243 [Liparis tanakae]
MWRNCSRMMGGRLEEVFSIVSYKVPPFTMTFCLSGWTPDRAKSCALNTMGGSSVFNSIASNFSLPHFTFTREKRKKKTDHV